MHPLPTRRGKGAARHRTPPSAPDGASISPYRGGFAGGCCFESRPSKGRWHRVSDAGGVHCRLVLEGSFRVALAFA